ncbi:MULTISPECIES: hypothetical protein [Micrococcaceae]|uniref:hypothetical protein n=1 Tax=Micrococcaceae TaxID=1268 RepID=UPI000A5E568C|nr:hypothetical protein [Arthrobacter sp. JCM 19049]
MPDQWSADAGLLTVALSDDEAVTGFDDGVLMETPRQESSWRGVGGHGGGLIVSGAVPIR